VTQDTEAWKERGEGQSIKFASATDSWRSTDKYVYNNLTINSSFQNSVLLDVVGQQLPSHHVGQHLAMNATADL